MFELLLASKMPVKELAAEYRPFQVLKIIGNYSSTLQQAQFTFTFLSPLGNGSFGIVWLARDEETKSQVAIKRVHQNRNYHNRELVILRSLQHSNVVSLYKYFYVNDESGESFLNLVMEYIPNSLHNILMDESFSSITLVHLKLYMRQLFSALAYLHGRGCCHRDVKPQNILIDRGCLKICDFGSAKELISGEPNISYICSRFYRAPEVLLGSTDYSTAIDVWSAGCVLLEIWLKRPYFAGKNTADQLQLIVNQLGSPADTDWEAMRVPARQLAPCSDSTPLAAALEQAHLPRVAIELASKIFCYSPQNRITAADCLLHPFLRV